MEAAMKKNCSEKCPYKIKTNTNNKSTNKRALLLAILYVDIIEKYITKHKPQPNNIFRKKEKPNKPQKHEIQRVSSLMSSLPGKSSSKSASYVINCTNIFF